MDHALAGQPNVGFPAPSDKVANGDKVDSARSPVQTVAAPTPRCRPASRSSAARRRLELPAGPRRLHQPTRHGATAAGRSRCTSRGRPRRTSRRARQPPSRQAPPRRATAAATRERRDRSGHRREADRLEAASRVAPWSASTFRTTAATRPPSARPATRGWTAFMTRPICGIPVAPVSATASATSASISSSPAAPAGRPR